MSPDEIGPARKRKKRTPTRVTTACDRCRRQKQRCDDFRPCSNCVHARTGCTSTQLETASELDRPAKRPGSILRAATGPQELAHERSRSAFIQHLEADAVNYSVSPSSKILGDYEDGSDHMASLSRNQPNLEITSQSLHDIDEERWQAETQPQEDSAGMATLQAESAIDMTRRLFTHGSGSSPFASRATFAIPGGEAQHQKSASNARITVRDLVGVDLPHRSLCESLLDTYFVTVHWFSLVVFEPKFRARYENIIDTGYARRSDRAFVLLLLMVLIMGCWYDASPELAEMQNNYLRVVREHFMDVIDEDSIEFVQLCALLGSFYLYHGRPRSSFSILGAATKTSQAIGLHREPDARLAKNDAEESKRVWWTIYTWDRFATIIYGRPLGINDKDCNVSMPAEVFENISSDRSNPTEPVCLSTYQTQLNQIYRIASPLLENIYGIRISTDLGLLSRLPNMIADVDRSLQEWKKALPAHLSYDLIEDIAEHSSTKDKLHALQALSLQLTYDNLMIVLHRTLLADQRESVVNGIRGFQRENIRADSVRSVDIESNFEEKHFERCLDAALSISQTQRKPNLMSLAQQSHLVSFLAMNLFTSSVVMSLCALSDTMSDVAQEAKRGMSRTLNSLRKLSSRASLPMQCSMILEDLVGLILEKEKTAMLFGPENGSKITVQSIDARVAEDLDGLSEEQPLDNLQAQTAYRSRAHSYSHPQAQSIFDLQRIFEENWGAKSQHVPASYSNNDTQVGNDNGGFGMLNNANAQPDDLGQFWLWNVEPFQQSG